MPDDFVLNTDPALLKDMRSVSITQPELDSAEEPGETVRAALKTENGAPDIILEDYSVRVVNGTLRIDQGRKLVVGNTIEISSGSASAEDPTGRVKVDGKFFCTELWGRQFVGGRRGGFGELAAREVTVGPNGGGEGSRPAGELAIQDTNSEKTIQLVGEGGDIVLARIGSLLDKITELESRLQGLEERQ